MSHVSSTFPTSPFSSRESWDLFIDGSQEIAQLRDKELVPVPTSFPETGMLCPAFLTKASLPQHQTTIVKIATLTSLGLTREQVVKALPQDISGPTENKLSEDEEDDDNVTDDDYQDDDDDIQ